MSKSTTTTTTKGILMESLKSGDKIEYILEDWQNSEEKGYHSAYVVSNDKNKQELTLQMKNKPFTVSWFAIAKFWVIIQCKKSEEDNPNILKLENDDRTYFICRNEKTKKNDKQKKKRRFKASSSESSD